MTFVLLPYSVLDDLRLSKSDIQVYIALARYADNETRLCYPSMATIAKVSRLRRPTICKSLINLESYGYIIIKRQHGHVNHYQLPVKLKHHH